MTYTHKNEGTCSRSVSFDVNEEGIVTNVRFEGGCNGNTKGVAALCEGRRAPTSLSESCPASSAALRALHVPTSWQRRLPK